MKHLKYLLFILLIPLNVFAYGVQLSCPTSIKENDTFNCTIYSPSSCSEISLKLVLPDGFSLQSEKPASYFKSTSNGNNLMYERIGVIDRVLSTITITAPKGIKSNNITIELQNIKYKYDSSDLEYTTSSNVSATIKIITTTTTSTTTTTTTTKVIDNYVLTLDSNNEANNTQTLSCAPTNGSCTVDLSNVNTPSKEGYIFNGWGSNKTCTEGEKTKLELKKDTTVYACYKDSIIKTAHLEKIEIKGYTIEYNSQILEYSINVPKETTIDDIKITVTPFSNKAKAEITKPDTLVAGENQFIITVTENEERVNYIIKVFKESEPAPYLVDLFIDGYLLDFKKDTLNYELKINHNTDSLNIFAVPNDPSNKVDIYGNAQLSKGGTIQIILTGNDGTTTTYTIKIGIKNFFDQYKDYFIALGVAIFMFTTYFIVKHIKKQNGEISSNESIVKKEKQPKEKKERKPLFGKKKTEKTAPSNIETPLAETPSEENIETL